MATVPTKYLATLILGLITACSAQPKQSTPRMAPISPDSANSPTDHRTGAALSNSAWRSVSGAELADTGYAGNVSMALRRTVPILH